MLGEKIGEHDGLEPRASLGLRDERVQSLDRSGIRDHDRHFGAAPSRFLNHLKRQTVGAVSQHALDAPIRFRRSLGGF